MSIARNHHYVPRAYLAAFTQIGNRNGKLFVLNVNTGQGFHTSLKNVAVERDFNRVDIEGHDLDILERALSSFEDRAAQAIRTVLREQIFPDNEDYNFIINLLGLLAVRNPRLRKSFNHAREQQIHLMGDNLVVNREIFANHLRKAHAAGYIDDVNVSFEDMSRFIRERRYQIEFTPEGNLRVEFGALDSLLPILARRKWSVLLAPTSGPDFVSSDHPVTLTWKDHAKHGPIGYGLRNTEVFFPLGPKAGIYGVYEDALESVVSISPQQVAIMNSRIASNAEKHVFSSERTFAVWYSGGIRAVTCGSESPDLHK